MLLTANLDAEFDPITALILDAFNVETRIDARVQAKAVPAFPAARERALQKIMGRRLRLARGALESRLDPTLTRFAETIEENARADRDEALISGLAIGNTEEARAAFNRVVSDDDLIAELTRQAELGDKAATASLARVAGAAAAQADLSQLRQTWIRENVELIKKAEAKYFEQIAAVVSEGVTTGRTNRAIAKELKERFKVADGHEKLIARDQAATLNGKITEARQTSVGITEYIWRTSRDERVREEHADREGDTFSWSNPPEDGPPGIPINCRCTAEPVIPEGL